MSSFHHDIVRKHLDHQQVILCRSFIYHLSFLHSPHLVANTPLKLTYSHSPHLMAKRYLLLLHTHHHRSLWPKVRTSSGRLRTSSVRLWTLVAQGRHLLENSSFCPGTWDEALHGLHVEELVVFTLCALVRRSCWQSPSDLQYSLHSFLRATVARASP
jgi:hypothetical protein